MTSIPKNVYIDKLDYLVDKYNHIYHRTIKKNLLMRNEGHILTLVNKLLSRP